MYTLLAVDIESTGPDDPWLQIDWGAYGFDPHIQHTDAAHMPEAVQTTKPDAVFLDIDRNLALLIVEISQRDHFCPCVVFSREADHDHMREAMRAGAYDYCVKPVTRESLNEIACILKRRLNEHAKGPAPQDKRLIDIAAYMEDHLHQKLTLARIADAFYMSKNYLCYYFKSHMGVNFIDYLSSLRIDKAKNLLASPMTLDEIAEKTGFSDTPYFIKVFKKYEGISPGAYRRAL